MSEPHSPQISQQLSGTFSPNKIRREQDLMQQHYQMFNLTERLLESASFSSYLRNLAETEENWFECSGRTAESKAAVFLSTLRELIDSLEQDIFRCGLQNLGNTDFINAALNGLYSLRSFRSFFTSQENQNPLFCALKEFCEQYTQEEVPLNLLFVFKGAISEFSDGRQHRANSYIFKLLMLLDTLLPTPSTTTFPQDIFGNTLRQYRKGKCEPLHDIFGSLAENLFICTECLHTRRNFSYFRTVDVPIPYSAETSSEVTIFSPNNFYPGQLAKEYTGTEASEMTYKQKFFRRSLELPLFTSLPTLSRTDLSQCFKYMLRASLMSPQSLMQCDDCGFETQHYKQSFFRQLSTTLVIHFQRFDERSGNKLDILVDFPMNLDMSDYCVNDPRKYQLCGVMYHTGNLNTGHYYSWIKVEGRWYNVDDSLVTEKRNSPPIENAYMLFYEEGSNHDIYCKVNLIKALLQLAKIGKIKTKSLTFDAFSRLKALKSRRFIEGLKNLGNTCFMNAALNGLFSLQAFRTYFATTVSTSSKDSLVLALATFCNKYMRGKVQEAVLRQLITIPKFSAEKMDCSNRYVRELLIHLDALLVCKSQTQLPNSVFEGQLKQCRNGKCEPLHDISSVLIENLFTCTVCGNTQQKFFYSRTIDVPVPYNHVQVTLFGEKGLYSHFIAAAYTGTKESESVYQNRCKQILEKPFDGSLSSGKKTPIKLSLCFEYMLRASHMSAQNKMPCGTCRTDTQHRKESFFRYLSTALIIHFQRTDESTNQKSDTPVAFPMELDMSEYYANDPRLYALRGVVYYSVPHGLGHYTAWINVEGRWYSVDDLSVREERGRPPIENAYMLFYEKEECS